MATKKDPSVWAQLRFALVVTAVCVILNGLLYVGMLQKSEVVSFLFGIYGFLFSSLPLTILAYSNSLWYFLLFSAAYFFLIGLLSAAILKDAARRFYLRALGVFILTTMWVSLLLYLLIGGSL